MERTLRNKAVHLSYNVLALASLHASLQSSIQTSLHGQRSKASPLCCESHQRREAIVGVTTKTLDFIT